ncbi:MAG: hypothetical protein DCC75_00550 [Proteobacteria bacterium]|nr:MAG: hypothetical protein DCC75_00550 [Pseudomonadota bacterium]
MRSRLIRNLVALVLLAALFYIVNLEELWQALKNLTWSSVVLLLGISVVLVYLSAWKWKLFLDHMHGGARLSSIRLFLLYLIGYFVNLILPSYIGGDAVRSFYAGKHVGQHQAATATILERYTGLVAMLLLALAGMWFSSLVTWQIKTCVITISALLVLITWLSLSKRGLARLLALPKLDSLRPSFEKIRDGINSARGKSGLIIQAMLLSFAYHSFTVLNTIIAGYAVGWFDIPVTDLFVVLPLILLIGSLPVAPSGLGIQEGAFFYFLYGIGATPAQALGVGLVLRAKSYLLAVFGGFIWLLERRSSAGLSPSS